MHELRMMAVTKFCGWLVVGVTLRSHSCITITP